MPAAGPGVGVRPTSGEAVVRGGNAVSVKGPVWERPRIMARAVRGPLHWRGRGTKLPPTRIPGLRAAAVAVHAGARVGSRKRTYGASVVGGSIDVHAVRWRVIPVRVDGCARLV